MNDHDLDVLLRASAPITDAAVDSLDLDGATRELRTAIVATNPAPTAALPTAASIRPGTHRVRLLMRAGPRRTALAVCALAAIAIGAGVGINGQLTGGPSTAWSAEAVRFAESSPRLLISGGDYRVVRADQNDAFGEMAFAPTHQTATAKGGYENGASLIEWGDANGSFKASWYDAASWSGRLAALTHAGSRATDLGTTDALGRGTRWFRIDGTDRFRALVLRGDYMIDVHGTAPNAEAFLRSLRNEASTNLRPGGIEPRQEIQVNWSPARNRGPQVDGLGGPGSGQTDLGTTNALGQQVHWVKYDEVDRFTAVWRQGNFTIAVDGIAAGKEAFADVLDRLIVVDVDTWLRAMPASVVRPVDLADASKAMLAGVPLPPNWTSTGLPASVGKDIRDRYQLGAAVTGAVTCAWLEEWLLARHAGDAPRARAAADAMATSRRWKILNEMKPSGAYPEVVWEYADVMSGRRAAVSSGGKVPDTTRVIDGTTVTVPGTIGDYPAALGCR